MRTSSYIVTVVWGALVVLAASIACSSSSSSSTGTDAKTDGTDLTGDTDSTDGPFSCASECDGSHEVSAGACCDDDCYRCTPGELGISRQCLDHVCTEGPCAEITTLAVGEPCWNPDWNSTPPNPESACTKCGDGLTCKEDVCIE